VTSWTPRALRLARIACTVVAAFSTLPTTAGRRSAAARRSTAAAPWASARPGRCRRKRACCCALVPWTPGPLTCALARYPARPAAPCSSIPPRSWGPYSAFPDRQVRGIRSTVVRIRVPPTSDDEATWLAGHAVHLDPAEAVSRRSILRCTVDALTGKYGRLFTTGRNRLVAASC
jgi:hypothetical protein